MAAGHKDAKSEVQSALRVSQLDAADLDSELFSLIKSQIENVFKYFKYALNEHEATIGQQLLDLHYASYSGSELHRKPTLMSGQQKLLYTFFIVGGVWIEERMDDIASRNQTITHIMWRAMRWVVSIWKVASFLNFLSFLTTGRYRFITERLLRIRPVFPHAQSVRQVGFEMMDRELLWHGFAEFLFFVLPLVNFRRTKNFIVRSIFPKSPSPANIGRTEADCHECIICGEWPFNPHEIGCRHVFCYYCIQSNLKADPSFSCPICGHKVDSSGLSTPVNLSLTAMHKSQIIPPVI